MGPDWGCSGVNAGGDPCVLRLRFQDSTALTETFTSKQNLASIFAFIRKERNLPKHRAIELCQNYPRKTFHSKDRSTLMQTLEDLGVESRSVLLVHEMDG